MKAPEHILESVITMLATAKVAKAIGAVLGGFAGYFLPTAALRELALGAFSLVLVDTITGVVASRSDGLPISSARFGRLLTKLVGYGAVVIVCTLVSKNLPGMGELAPVASTAALSLIMVTESISIIENLDRMGVPFPKFIREALQAQRDKRNDLPIAGKKDKQ